MRLLVRCKGTKTQTCHNWYSLEKHEACPRCGHRWKFPTARFYADFRHKGRRYRKKLKARDLHHAIVEIESVDPVEAVKPKVETKVVDPCLADAVAEFLEHSRVEGCAKDKGHRLPNRKETLASKGMSFRNYWIPYIGARTRLSEINQKAVIQFKEEMRYGERIKRDRSPASVNLDLRYWFSFCNWAVKQGYPLDRRCTDVGFLPVTQREGKLNEIQLETILSDLANSTMTEVQRDLFLLTMSHGGRCWSQCASIERSWINFELGYYVVPGNRDKAGRPVTLVLGRVGMEILSRRAREAEKAGTPFLFANPKTGKPFTSSCFRAFFRKLEKERDIRINTKSFRHHWASEANLENAYLGVQSLGHTTPTVAIGSYTHYQITEQRKLANDVEDKIFGVVYERDTLTDTCGTPTLPKSP